MLLECSSAKVALEDLKLYLSESHKTSITTQVHDCIMQFSLILSAHYIHRVSFTRIKNRHSKIKRYDHLSSATTFFSKIAKFPGQFKQFEAIVPTDQVAIFREEHLKFSIGL